VIYDQWKSLDQIIFLFKAELSVFLLPPLHYIHLTHSFIIHSHMYSKFKVNSIRAFLMDLKAKCIYREKARVNISLPAF
jgi:hypothetical protein